MARAQISKGPAGEELTISRMGRVGYVLGAAAVAAAAGAAAAVAATEALAMNNAVQMNDAVQNKNREDLNMVLSGVAAAGKPPTWRMRQAIAVGFGLVSA